MAKPHPTHFTGTIEQVHDGDDATVTLDIRATHRIHRISGERRTMVPFLERWAEAGFPPVHVDAAGHLSLGHNPTVTHRSTN